MKIMKKRQVGGLKNFFLIYLLIFLFGKSVFAQILDYETEKFIEKLVLEIKKVNKINKIINYKIIPNNNINAFVDKNNIIYITSGLIENSEDYVAFLSVLAHEIGHIDRNHIVLRKSSIDSMKNLKSISDLSIIAGSLISGNPQVLQGIALSSAGITDMHINFTKDQEREADYYSLNTLKKLNLKSNSIINLLKTLEEKSLQKGITKEKHRLSTHPYFDERIDIVKYLNTDSGIIYNQNVNHNFNFIRAKFLGYSENLALIEEIKDPYKKYAVSILEAKKGNLLESLSLLNGLIAEYDNNIFLVETKADILYSFGYTQEAIEFYQIVLNNLPKNDYARIRIFQNINLEDLDFIKIEDVFNNNLNLIYKYYTNKNILYKYLDLAKITERKEWVEFLSLLIFDLNDKTTIKEIDLDKYKESKDKKLINLVQVISKNK